MSEEKFTELVNLYLDKEISERGLADLKAELRVNPQRKAAFQERCRLHQAMRLALNPSVTRTTKARATSRRSSSQASKAKNSNSGRSNSRRSSSRHSERSAGRLSHKAVQFETRHEASTFSEKGLMPRWVLGTGLAASFAIGFTLLAPVFRGGLHFASQPVLEDIEGDELLDADPLDSIGRAELRRYASTQAQRASHQRASIAAQLRLMGLRPEFTPEEKQLRSVSLASAQRPQPTRNDADLLAGVQQMTPMPTPQILRVAADSAAHDSSLRWPSGFQTSLASFK